MFVAVLFVMFILAVIITAIVLAKGGCKNCPALEGSTSRHFPQVTTDTRAALQHRFRTTPKLYPTEPADLEPFDWMKTSRI